MKWHPDKRQSASHSNVDNEITEEDNEHFKKISTAYETLSDSRARQEYNTQLLEKLMMDAEPFHRHRHQHNHHHFQHDPMTAFSSHVAATEHMMDMFSDDDGESFSMFSPRHSMFHQDPRSAFHDIFVQFGHHVFRAAMRDHHIFSADDADDPYEFEQQFMEDIMIDRRMYSRESPQPSPARRSRHSNNVSSPGACRPSQQTSNSSERGNVRVRRRT